MKINRAFLYGLIFGLFLPIFGLFVGLQVSSAFGNMIMFPFHIIGYFLDEPYGNWSAIMRIIGILFSMITWGFIFFIFSKLFK